MLDLSEEVANNDIFCAHNGGARCLAFYAWQKRGLVATLIHKQAWGFQIKNPGTLRTFGLENGVRNNVKDKEIHHCFVLPMVNFFVRELLLPEYGDITVNAILNTNVKSFRRTSRDKMLRWGIWSDERAKRELHEGRVHEGMVDHLHGMELQHLRVHVLIDPTFNNRGKVPNKKNGAMNPNLKYVEPGDMETVGENINEYVRSFRGRA